MSEENIFPINFTVEVLPDAFSLPLDSFKLSLELEIDKVSRDLRSHALAEYNLRNGNASS